jgi:hypothetical protein
MKRILFLLSLSLACSFSAMAQDDLLDLLDAEQEEPDTFVEATFKGQRLINGHTVQTRKKGELEFIIAHRFGRLNSGISELFGLDGANIRFSFEYGLSDRLTAGLGRNSFQKVYDGFLKYKIMKQQSGSGNPVTMTWFSNIAARTIDEPAFDNDNVESKISYTNQLLIARKFTDELSLQLTPTYVHRNKVLENQENDILALGMGGRYKLNSRVALNIEYYYRLTDELNDTFNDSLGIGIEIETGGHVFHLNFTNSRSLTERAFITETDGDFFNGDIHFGFNLSRTF